VAYTSPLGYTFVLLFYSLVNTFAVIGISLAILRHQLWEIDIIINRTLVYGSLTALLALLYVGLVIGLGTLVHLFTGQASQSPIVIVASTLAIAALFQPLRRRLQNIIDRRFYRSNYDAAHTLAAFSATLRTEVELSKICENLVAVVQEKMQPTHVSLWLRSQSTTKYTRWPGLTILLLPLMRNEARRSKWPPLNLSLSISA